MDNFQNRLNCLQYCLLCSLFLQELKKIQITTMLNTMIYFFNEKKKSLNLDAFGDLRNIKP